MELEMQSNQYELLDMLTSLLNLTIIEEADRTNELLSTYIDYIKYKYTEKSTFVHFRRAGACGAVPDIPEKENRGPAGVFHPGSKGTAYAEDAF